jgi:hypothetical protein
MYLALDHIIVVFALCALAYFLWHGLKVRERAFKYAAQHCTKESLQMLDQSVSFTGFGIIFGGKIPVRLKRIYSFEFTVTGGERYKGRLEMAGVRLFKITLPPHKIPTNVTTVESD